MFMSKNQHPHHFIFHEMWNMSMEIKAHHWSCIAGKSYLLFVLLSPWLSQATSGDFRMYVWWYCSCGSCLKFLTAWHQAVSYNITLPDYKPQHSSHRWFTVTILSDLWHHALFHGSVWASFTGQKTNVTIPVVMWTACVCVKESFHTEEGY